jgi:hypothetical protein
MSALGQKQTVSNVGYSHLDVGIVAIYPLFDGDPIG